MEPNAQRLIEETRAKSGGLDSKLEARKKEFLNEVDFKKLHQDQDELRRKKDRETHFAKRRAMALSSYQDAPEAASMDYQVPYIFVTI